MIIQISVGGVVFRRKNNKIYFLLLKTHEVKQDGSVHEWWEFPKGVKEKKETDYQTLIREITEETGLKKLIVLGYCGEITYFFRSEDSHQTVKKTVKYYLVEAKDAEVKISWEHIDFVWAPYEEAMHLLKFKNHREILKRAYDKIINKDFEYQTLLTNFLDDPSS